MSPNSPEIRNWVIYKITSPSGRNYIGKTCNLKSRLNDYRSLSKAVNKQRIIVNSIRRYGLENHLIELLDEFSSNETFAFGKEIFWIRSFMSNINKWPNGNGMNLSDGGEGPLGAKFPNRTSGMKDKKHSDETKALLRTIALANPQWHQYWKGKNLSETAKNKMSLAKKGKPSNFKGRKHSMESNLKNSLAHKHKNQ